MLGRLQQSDEHAENAGSGLSKFAHARGILVAIHVVAITVGSLPVLVDQRVLTPEAWQDPIAQAEFADWADRLTAWGFETTQEDVAQSSWDTASGILAVQQTLNRPFQPYYQIAGTRQRWRMFPAAVEEPVRLRIDVETNQIWETVYLMGSSDKRWLAGHFDRDRFRAALNLYAWGLYPETYEQFVDWLAAEAERDFPNANQIRIGFEVVPAMDPDNTTALPPLPFTEAKQLRHRVLNP